MIAGAIFGGSAWVATSAYFIGMAAIIISGIMLKKTKMFSGDPAPFVMELPAYHLPTVGNVLRSMWERGWSFIKKAGTIILLSTIFVWFTTYFGFTDDGFRMLSEDELDLSILATIGSAIAWIFKPLGFGTWQATVASITGHDGHTAVTFIFNGTGCHDAGDTAACTDKHRNEGLTGKAEFAEDTVKDECNTCHITAPFKECEKQEQNEHLRYEAENSADTCDDTVKDQTAEPFGAYRIVAVNTESVADEYRDTGDPYTVVSGVGSGKLGITFGEILHSVKI